MYQDDLAKLSKEELIALVLAQEGQIEQLTRRIAELEAKLGGPPKSPDNSSIPPSQGRKPSRAERRAAKKRKGRPGVFRALAPNPDPIIESVAERCPHCEHALTPADQSGFRAGACPRAGQRPDPGDQIELPPLRPVITRIHRHRGVCPNCRRGFTAPAPAEMPPGSPPAFARAGSLAPTPAFAGAGSGGADRAPARHPGDRLRAAGAPAGRSLRYPHQRGRHCQYAGPCWRTADPRR